MFRIGIGYDIHQLVTDRPLILGGVTLEYQLGLSGHSDADVLVHAIMDALLGAAALGDIGQKFPPGDPQYLNADSRNLLREVRGMVAGAGFDIGNIDSLIIAEEPKLRPYIDRMRENIAEDLQIPVSQVGVKATTNESLGPTGRKEGIAAQAVALLHLHQSS